MSWISSPFSLHWYIVFYFSFVCMIISRKPYLNYHQDGSNSPIWRIIEGWDCVWFKISLLVITLSIWKKMTNHRFKLNFHKGTSIEVKTSVFPHALFFLRHYFMSWSGGVCNWYVEFVIKDILALILLLSIPTFLNYMAFHFVDIIKVVTR